MSNRITASDLVSNIDVFLGKCPKSGALAPLVARGNIWRSSINAAAASSPDPFTQSTFRGIVKVFADDARKCAAAADVAQKQTIVTAANNVASLMERACEQGASAVTSTDAASNVETTEAPTTSSKGKTK